MKKLIVYFLVGLAWLAGSNARFSKACTSVLVSRGASVDGSVMISYLADAGGFMDPLNFYPGGTHQPGDSVDIICWHHGHLLGRIAQVPRTYRVIGNMNEHQVAIGETTFTGRTELHDPNGFIDYGAMMYITLQRARTAREAIKIMTGLVEKYGYASTGESFSIADENEAWVMEFIGKGRHGSGAVWVAARVPEGYMAAHANQARIRKVNWNDTENWMWSEDVVDFARKMGWFDGPKEEFNFVDAYAPVTPRTLMICEGRVWSIFNRAAPSQNFSPEFWRGVIGAEPYPLFIRPDRKLSVQDMKSLVRDHFDGTPFYTGAGFSAGPFALPYRWRPLGFTIEGCDRVFSWPRPISQPQTGFSFISQSRNWLPDPIGGIFWYGLDDTYSNAYMPLYVGMTRPPVSLITGNIVEFDMNSAFWVFNLVANFAYGLYSFMIEDIKKVQYELESRSRAMTKAVDIAALALYATNPQMMHEYLTKFSVSNAENTVERWRQLAGYLISKYNDRYIRTGTSLRPWPEGVGYPEEFRRRAVEDRPHMYEVRWRQRGEPLY